MSDSARLGAGEADPLSGLAVEAVVEASPLPIVVFDREGRVVVWSRAAERTFGWRAEEVLGRPNPLVPEGEWEAFRQALALVFEQGKAWRSVEVPRQGKDGSPIYVSASSAPLRDGSGGVVGMLAVLADVTDRKKTEQQLVESEQRLRAIFEKAPIGVALVAPSGRWLQVNQALCELLGYSEDELLRLTFADVTHPDDLAASLARRSRQLEGALDLTRIEKRYVRSDGEVVWAAVSSTLVHDADGKSLYTVAQIEDISELKRTEGELTRLAENDSLTDLGNRRKLMSDLEQTLETGAAADPRLLIIFDLDGFKRYNDSFGHPAGDALLARLASKLATAARPHGQAYRLGGDEFCVLAGPPASDAETYLNTVATALHEDGEGFSVSSSFGAAFLPEEAADPSSALGLADQRLYAHKQQAYAGRDKPHEILLQALAEREPSLREQSAGVAALSVALGARLGLRGDALEELRLAAELHDVGKLAIPDAVLHKPGPLSKDEWAFVHQHTLIGQRILAGAPALRAIGEIVRSTHERWDGAGYIDGLASSEIPLAARIIAVCDAYSAMTSERPYRKAISSSEALAELRRGASSQFDPDIVRAFCEQLQATEQSTNRPEDSPPPLPHPEHARPSSREAVD
jgi:PAS domain S-box-containing protein/diguanylate cyclase (GGDEF)-like protein